MMRLAYFLSLSLFVLACKPETSPPSVTAVQKMRIIHPDSLQVPNACELISEASVKKIFNLNKSSLNVKDSSDPEQKGVKSCFFRWDDPALSFPGIMLQVNTNQVYDDQKDNIPQFINTLLQEGSMEVDANSPNKFKEFMIGDIKGAYSFKMSRFHWNLGPNYGFMLAFNVPLSESKMVNVAKEIAAEVNSTFAGKVLIKK